MNDQGHDPRNHYGRLMRKVEPERPPMTQAEYSHMLAMQNAFSRQSLQQSAYSQHLIGLQSFASQQQQGACGSLGGALGWPFGR